MVPFSPSNEIDHITLVCRSWYQIGIVFLYKDICIRRFPQLQSLCETLDTSNLSTRDFCPLVKSLDIQCYVPEICAQEFANNLCRIMDRCPSISTFAYTSPCTLPHSILPTNRLKPQVTCLRLYHTVQYLDFIAILHELQDQLLVLHVQMPKQSLNILQPETKLVFPLLRSLSLTRQPERDQDSLRSILNAHWRMPSLQRLSVWHDHDFIVDFLSSYGQRLLYLLIENFFYIDHFVKVLEKCPILERLVAHPTVFQRANWAPDNQVLHPKLRFLDLNYSLSERFSYADNKLWISKDVLPSLQRVRHLCNIPTYASAWLENFDPSCSEIGSEDFTLQLFHHQAVYKNGTLLYQNYPKLKPPTFESYVEPVMSWRFSDNRDDESPSDYEVPWNVPASEDDETSTDAELSSNGSFSDGDEWMSGDDVSALSR